MSDFLKTRSYEVKLIDNLEYYNVDGLTDVFLSFSPDYNICNIDARKNTIKALFLDNVDTLENMNKKDLNKLRN